MLANARLALVTGASRGIGAVTAGVLSARGWRLALLARSERRLAELAARIEQTGGQAVVLPCDLRDPAQIDAALRVLAARDERVDALVNNAGFGGPRRPATDLSDELWRDVFATNLDAPIRLIRALLPGMIQRRFGRIVNVASVLAWKGAAGSSAYAASKHALLGYTRSVAMELAGSGVSIAAVCPGYVDTEMLQDAGGEPRDLDPALMPAGRILTAAEVADSIVRLVCDPTTSGNGAIVQPGVDPG